MRLLDTLFSSPWDILYPLPGAHYSGSLSYRQEPKSRFSVLIYNQMIISYIPLFLPNSASKIAQLPSSESQLPKVMWNVHVISVSIKHLELEYTVPTYWQTSVSLPAENHDIMLPHVLLLFHLVAVAALIHWIWGQKGWQQQERTLH